MVTGDMNDEGTLFSVTSVNVTTEEQARKYLRETYAPKATDAEVEQLATLYPQDPNVGSPYDTQFRNQLTRSFTFDFRFHNKSKRSKSNRDDFVLTFP
jgi:acetylcholinesterase